MSKYILKKDLPFAKAGEELAEFGDYLTCWETKGALNIPPGLEATSYCVGKVKDLEKLIAEGWIEKVKDFQQVPNSTAQLTDDQVKRCMNDIKTGLKTYMDGYMQGKFDIKKEKRSIRKWFCELNYEVTLSMIKDLVEKYPDEVQKEVMKHGVKIMKDWYDDQYKIKSIPKVIRNTIDIARRNGKIIDSFYLSPILFNSFLDDVKNEIGDFNYQDAYFRGRCRFEGVNIEKKSDETDMSFAYKEPEKAKTEPKEEAGITKIDIPVNLPITENHLGGLAYLTMSMEGYERIILNGGYEFKFVKKEPKSDKEPRELKVIYTADNKEIHSITGLPQIPRTHYEDLNDGKHKPVLFREVME